MSSEGAEEKKVTVRSSDGQVFELSLTVAKQSQTLKHMIEDGCADNCIPMPNVTGKILAKVIEYCQKHAEASAAEKDLKAFDAEFMKVDQTTLYDLIMAANYLNVEDLLDLACQGVANRIRGKSPKEIRKLFNIKNDFTPEEEEEIRKESQWALL